jgi:2-oxoglutarate ferredoxin oxidoreductase subunit alpha
MSENKPTLFTWKIAGEAGFGINTTGLLFSKIITRSGLYAFEYSEYPSLIRGGHQTSQVSISDMPVFSIYKNVNLLVCLNRDSLRLHVDELAKNSAVIVDSAQYTLSQAETFLGHKIKETVLFEVPLTELAVKHAGLNIMRNMVAVGASLYMHGLGTDIAIDLIAEVYPEAREENIAAVRAGYDYMVEHYEALAATFEHKVKTLRSEHRRYLLTGNEALGIGAIKGGVSFYAGYPMTPSSTLMAFMAEHQYEYQMLVRHAEDEISVLNMAIGAAYAGARAMVATSGGGMALMSEAVGLAAITEVPIVIVNVQRPGPATGLPTWTDQGDLRFVLHAGQGEFLRLIIAPGDLEECYSTINEALNLAEKYQIPVILLSDKYLAESHATIEKMPDVGKVERGKTIVSTQEMIEVNGRNGILPFERYVPTNDGVSWRTVPGVEHGIYLANSDEHDHHGYSAEEGDTRLEQVDKRAMKLHPLLAELPRPRVYGNPDSSVLLVAWGSLKGPILEAMKQLEMNYDTNFAFVHLVYVWPFPIEEMRKLFERYRRVILIENNSMAQLGGLIAQMTEVHIHEKWLKYDGRPFFVEELFTKLEDVLHNR